MSVVHLRAGWWALRAWAECRRQLTEQTVDGICLTAPRNLPAAELKVVNAVLQIVRASCLVRSLVVQAWHAGHGTHVNVVIGVTAPSNFAAHAWLEHPDQPMSTTCFTPIHRVRLPPAP